MQRSDYGMDDLGEHGEPSPPANANETPMTEEGAGATTVFIPASLYSNKEFAVGDEIVLRVARVDDDGLEATYATGEDEPDKGDSATPMRDADEGANSMIDRAANPGNGVSSY